MNKCTRTAVAWLVAGCLAGATHSFALENLKKEIDEAGKALQDAPVDTTERINKLNAAIKEGKEAAQTLQGRITELEREKQELEKVQTALTSGLIGALVAAVVAIAGALGKFWTSRAERDLKRLEVIDKMTLLAAKGVAIPEDIRGGYEAHRSGQVGNQASQTDNVAS